MNDKARVREIEKALASCRKFISDMHKPRAAGAYTISSYEPCGRLLDEITAAERAIAALPAGAAMTEEEAAFVNDMRENIAHVGCGNEQAFTLISIIDRLSTTGVGMTEEERELVERERQDAIRAIDGGRLYEGKRIQRLLAIIDRYISTTPQPATRKEGEADQAAPRHKGASGQDNDSPGSDTVSRGALPQPVAAGELGAVAESIRAMKGGDGEKSCK